MKKAVCFFSFIGIINSQVADFNFHSNKPERSKSISNNTSFWLSEILIINPMNDSRLTIGFGHSISISKINERHWFLPNFGFGYKISNNLALTGKAYGFLTKNENPQVTGGGLQYFIGEKEKEKDFVFAIDKSNLRGLKDFRLSCLTIDIQKWKKRGDIILNIGFGSNFFKEVTHGAVIETPKKIEGQTNFFSFSLIKNIYGTVLGGRLKYHPKRYYFSWFIQKNF